MKRILCLSTILLLAATNTRADYKDHRGHNVDSLEAVVAAWTPQQIDAASQEEYESLVNAYEDLMRGYQQINRIKSIYYARKLRELAEPKNYLRTLVSADKMVGQHFWAAQQYDSAAFYYKRALGYVERMAAGEKSLPSDKEYDPATVDDARSSLYGAIGNLYNMMDSIDIAMDYYAKAGELFDKYDWKESNSVLWYNIGETWVGEQDYKQAKPAYERSLAFARAAGDSLLAANALKGLGGLYMDLGRPMRALPYLREADRYYSLHEDQEFLARIENFSFMEKVLTAQKRTWTLLAVGAFCLVVLVVVLELVLSRIRHLRKEKEEADRVIEEAISAIGSDAGQNGEDSGDPVLTERELEILPLIAAGLTSQQIADRLCLSLPTIKWYRKRMLLKFEATNSADMVARAKEKGLV
ncbi:MAG: LuxR family transcriptional regulator [Bacteroidales bacterium]|nr:LuxR family transcriptional regulator [Bacteroidales bacterium]